MYVHKTGKTGKKALISRILGRSLILASIQLDIWIRFAADFLLVNQFYNFTTSKGTSYMQRNAWVVWITA